MFIGQKIYPVWYRIYLHLNFEHLERAKSYGCLWDSHIHKWYFHKEQYLKSGIKDNIVLHGELRPYMILNNVIHFV